MPEPRERPPIIDPVPDINSDFDEPPRPARGKRRGGRSHAVYRLAVGSIFCAMAAVMLSLGALVELLDMACAVMAAVILLPLYFRYGGGFMLTSWGVTSVLAVMLFPQSLSPWLFLCLTGFYPVLKGKIDRLPRWLSLLCKLLVACAAMAVYMLAFWVIMMSGSGSFADTFLLAFGDPEFGIGFAWIFIALCLITFFAYDLLVARVRVVYDLKWRARVEKWLK